MIPVIEHLSSVHHFFARFPVYAQAGCRDCEQITAAWNMLLDRRIPSPSSPLPYDAAHSLRMAYILASLEMDADAIVCALLYSEQAALDMPRAALEQQFGVAVINMLAAVGKFSDIKLYNKSKDQVDTICRMFFSMVDDLRVMIVGLADRLDKIRYITAYPLERQKIIVSEIIEIWAPLAQRMGIAAVQHELEDLSLKYSNREAFDQIKEVVASKKREREQFLQAVEKDIYKKLSDEGLTVQVQSRAKHFWSIYQKMKKRNKAADELYDLLAVRILCTAVSECYTILGLVHTIWKPLEGRFKDYIAMPKSNGYQSLHTTVLCEGQTLEIQIRTYDMHEVAEKGVASHWVYKKKNTHTSVSETELSFVRQIKQFSKQHFTNDDFLAELKHDLLGDFIYVFTPKGDIMSLPAGSTAVDFAYSIHSAVGEKLVSAKADGVIIPLSKPLKNTQVVEVITHPHAHPTQNQYEHAHTTKARQKIRAWLQLHAASASRPEKEAQEEKTHRSKQLTQSGKTKQEPKPTVLRIRVGDSAHFLIKFAQCCNPKPPVPICGYVSRGRGVIIHTAVCRNFLSIPDIDNRKIEVEWDTEKSKRESR